MKDREWKIAEKNSIRRPMVEIHSLLGIPQLKVSEGSHKIDWKTKGIEIVPLLKWNLQLLLPAKSVTIIRKKNKGKTFDD